MSSWMRASLCGCLALSLWFVGVFSDAPLGVDSFPTFPTQYEAVATLSLPYADIVEPLNVWYDGEAGRERLDYYDGTSVNVYRRDLNTTFLVTPTGVDKETCWKTYHNVSEDGGVTLQSIFPAAPASKWTLEKDTRVVRDVACAVWSYEEVPLASSPSKTNRFELYVSVVSHQPMRYRMMGYDTLFGSHYDEYVVDYLSVLRGVDPDAFEAPNMTCSWAPGTNGPSRARARALWASTDPMHDLARIFPGSRAHERSLRSHDADFAQFVTKFGRSYASAAEEAHRASVFAVNRYMVNSHNRKAASYKMKMIADAPLADLTKAERQQRRMSTNGVRSFERPAHNGALYVHQHSGAAPPDSWNWTALGATGPVKDQAVCGSCWSVGASQAIESAWFMETGELLVLSAQAIVDCAWDFGVYGCAGGFDFMAYQYVMQRGGLPLTKDYPYLGSNGYCRNASSVPSAVTIAGYVNVTSGDQDALMDALYSQGPISISIDASLDSLSFYASGVYDDQACKNGVNDLDHDVLLTGWGTEDGKDYWLVKNSWSTHYGDWGYMKIARKDNLCGVATAPTYVKVKA